MSNNIQRPKVFISYSWDSEEHKKWVLALSNDLIRDGTDCQIDQYVNLVEEGWPWWMEKQIESADFVLLVCTQKYYDRFHKRGEGGAGRGVAWEGAILTQIFYDNFCCNSRNKSFIPVLPDNVGEVNHIPIVLRGYPSFFIPSQYEDLLRLILKRPKIVKPLSGEPPPLPPEEIVSLRKKTDVPLQDLVEKKNAPTEKLFERRQELKRRLEQIEKEIEEEKAHLPEVPTYCRQAAEWLSIYQRDLAKDAGEKALRQIYGKNYSPEEIDNFLWEIEKLLELIYFCALTTSRVFLDGLSIRLTLPVEAHINALKYIKRNRLPADPTLSNVAAEIRSCLEYLIDRLEQRK